MTGVEKQSDAPGDGCPERVFQPPWLVGLSFTQSVLGYQRGGTPLVSVVPICACMAAEPCADRNVRFKKRSSWMVSADQQQRSKLGSSLVIVSEATSAWLVTESLSLVSLARDSASILSLKFKPLFACLALWLALNGEFRVILTSSGHFIEHKGTSPCCLQVLREMMTP